MLFRHLDDLFWRPWLDFHRFARRPASFGGGRSGFARLNLYTSDDEALVEGQLPGINPESLEITLESQTLTLSGERKAPDLDDATEHRCERSHGSFVRTVELPFVVDEEAVRATYNRGVLEVRLPRAKRDMPKKIRVQ